MDRSLHIGGQKESHTQYDVPTQCFNDICLETDQVFNVGALRLGTEGRVFLGIEEEVDYVCQS